MRDYENLFVWVKGMIENDESISSERIKRDIVVEIERNVCFGMS